MSSENWFPGSFTKNFSWGRDQGLLALHENICIGFNGEIQDVSRDEYRRRVAKAGRPDFIPINFFLFNKVKHGLSYIIVDELVFQALTAQHSPNFDKLALFALNFSRVGVWKGQAQGQRYPALWAQNYIIDQVARNYSWDTSNVSAMDIERYLRNAPAFRATTYRKVSTNLHYLYRIGDLGGFASNRIEKWWVDSLFLAIDRLISDLEIDKANISMSAIPSLLLSSKFSELTGPITPEKTFAMAHLFSLYAICGGARRFDPESVKQIIEVELPDYHWQEPNDARPQGALHPTNPRILKAIPRSCAELAKSVGFQIIYADDLEQFDPDRFIRDRAAQAVESIGDDNIRPVLSAEELHKITRGE